MAKKAREQAERFSIPSTRGHKILSIVVGSSSLCGLFYRVYVYAQKEGKVGMGHWLGLGLGVRVRG